MKSLLITVVFCLSCSIVGCTSSSKLSDIEVSDKVTVVVHDGQEYWRATGSAESSSLSLGYDMACTNARVHLIKYLAKPDPKKGWTYDLSLSQIACHLSEKENFIWRHRVVILAPCNLNKKQF